MRLHIKNILTIFLPALILFLPVFISAQDPAMEAKCLKLTQTGCEGMDKTACQADLKACDAYYSAESVRIQGDINQTAQEKNTLKNKISGLDKKIKELTNSINQSNLIIKDIKIQIDDTTSSIEKTILKIEDSKNKLANILRSIHEEDNKPLLEVLLAESDLSGFFDNMLNLEVLNESHRDILSQIKTLKENLENQKVSLDGEKTDLENTVKMSEQQKQEQASTKKTQQYYLSITEQEYQKQVQEKQETEKKAAAIKARIFELAGTTSKAPTFGEAYNVAKYVEGITGVRPALLLAVLQQESAIGKNVGQCYMTDSSTGSGQKVSGAPISRVMHPTRDVPVFMSIVAELGKDYTKTAVSCPMSFGYGGAMGPAQFIPSTWSLYRDRIKAITGLPSDPWNIKDSFLAAGLYLADSGATAQTYNAEWRAAMIYFSGSTNVKYRFYGDQVMAKATGFDKDIALLNQYAAR